MVLSFKARDFKWSLGVFSVLTLIISLITFPFLRVEAATVLLEIAEKRVQQDKAFVSDPINVSNYQDLTFSFSYDATTLDGFATTTGQDNFSYGWQIGSGDKHVLGTVIGLSGSTTAEHGLINVVLPETASVSNLVLFIEVSANSTTTSDKVEVRNISVSGNLKEDLETETKDVCLNLEGIQTEIPSGYEANAGNCTLIVTDPETVDVCLNLDGVQASVPEGYESKVTGNCTQIIIDPEPLDLCPNLEGNQAVMPENYIKNSAGNCVLVPPPVVTDVCPNIEGVQSEIPANYKIGSNGKCVPIVIESEPKPEPLACPKGYARWVNKFNGGNIWQADDVYKSVILVGKNNHFRRNFSISRHVYIPGPTEVGDRYYHRFQKISHVCVK